MCITVSTSDDVFRRISRCPRRRDIVTRDYYPIDISIKKESYGLPSKTPEYKKPEENEYLCYMLFVVHVYYNIVQYGTNFNFYENLQCISGLPAGC